MLNLTSEEINSIFPVIGLIVYPGGVVIRRSSTLNLNERRKILGRGDIIVLSKRSLNRLALLVRSSGVEWRSVWTLTYGCNFPVSGKTAKKHLNAFLVAARREFGPFEYFWVLEFQQRGAVHFHIATTLPEGIYPERYLLAKVWGRISQEGDWEYCPLNHGGRVNKGEIVLSTRQAVESVHEHPLAWERVREKDGMSRYLAKYANKLRQKDVPIWFREVGRFWGTSRGVKMPPGEFFHGNEGEIRQALAMQGRDVESWGVLPKIVLIG